MTSDFDLGIVGSGFGGSLLAMIARRLGLSVVMYDKSCHPRFAIGESSTPLANLLLEELAERYDLPEVKPLSKWGTWQKTCPDIGCGLKRGFSFLHHQLGRSWSGDGQHELLVSASPNDRVADTHWYRPDFDMHLARVAGGLGVTLLEETRLEKVERAGEGFVISGEREHRRFHHSVRFLADASGPRGFLFQQFALGEDPFADLPPTSALFGHFKGVKRWDALHPNVPPPPHPVDDAALHHLFEGGWIWLLRFNNGITSAGVAAVDHATLKLHEGESGWRRLLEQLPSVQEQFSQATAVMPMQHLSRLAFRCRKVAGPGWALLPSAAGVVDPLLSTGFTLNLLGIARLAQMLEEDGWRGDSMVAYESSTHTELDVTARLVSALYASMADFELFTTLSKLYFVAVGFTETMRRLGCGDKAGRWFLMADHPEFHRGYNACCEAALQLGRNSRSLDTEKRSQLLQQINSLIQPFDVMGLTQHRARRHYPARPEDLMASADKLGVTREDVRDMLVRCGMPLGHGV